MRVGLFSVIIPQGKEKDSGHVLVPHGTVYQLHLKNHHNNRRCDAKVTIDGKDVGTFRIAAFGTVPLERPVHDEGRFTFYRADTPEYAAAAGGDVAPDLRGLVTVVFRPEKAPRLRAARCSLPPDAFDRQGSATYSANREEETSGGIVLPFGEPLAARSITRSAGGQAQAGATGLSGHSDQKFTEVAELDYDPDEEVTINLRLAAYDAGPRPLLAAPKANPVPAPVA